MFDKFHIVSHLMAAVDQVRRDEIREKGPNHKALMHKTRFIWLKNPWNLTDLQQQRLGELERLNLKINRASLLKACFAGFWTYQRVGWARRYLKQWFWWATHARLPPLRDFAWMLRRHEAGVLNYFRMPINNGTVEGLNNKAKLVVHRAYGFRTAKNYIRNLYHCMGTCRYPKPCIHLCEEPDERKVYPIVSVRARRAAGGPDRAPLGGKRRRSAHSDGRSNWSPIWRGLVGN